MAVAGWAWVEALAEARLWPILIIPSAPAGLWLTQVGRLRSFRPVAGLAIQIVLTACIFGVASALLRIAAAEQFTLG
jgi:hypothetical protein